MGLLSPVSARIVPEYTPIPPPRENNAPGLKLEGTQDPEAALTLPMPIVPGGGAAPALPESKDSTAIRALLSQGEKYKQTVDAASHFFTTQQHDDYAAALKENDSLLNSAAQDKKSAAYLAHLEKRVALLKGLSDFVEFERGQGLVGTCAESGVRLYSNGGKLWFCTPDAKAFNDFSESDRRAIADFVHAVSGLEQVDITKACFQKTERSGERALLGCRLDALTMRSDAQNTFELTTKVDVGLQPREKRTLDDFREVSVRFVNGKLEEGAAQRLFAPKAPLPDVPPQQLIAATPADSEPKKADPAKAETAPLSPVVTADAIWAQAKDTVQRRLAKSALRLTDPKGEEPIPQAVAESKVAIDARRDLAQRAERELADPKTASETLKATREAIAASEKEYGQAMKQYRDYLQEQIKKQGGKANSAYHAAQEELATLEAHAARDILTRRNLLLNAIGKETDEAAKAGLQGELRKLAGRVEKAYDTLISRPSLDPAGMPVEQLKAERTTWAEHYRKNYQTTLEKIGSRFQQAGELLGKRIGVPGLSGLKEWLTNRALTGAEATLADAAKADPAALSTKERGRMLKDVEASERYAGKELKRLHDTPAKNRPADFEAQVKKLNELQADLTIQKHRLLEAELAKAGEDSAKRTAVIKRLEECAEDIRRAYTVKGDKEGLDRFDKSRGTENRQQTAEREAEILRLKDDSRIASRLKKRDSARRLVDEARSKKSANLGILEADLAECEALLDMRVADLKVSALENALKKAGADGEAIKSRLDAARAEGDAAAKRCGEAVVERNRLWTESMERDLNVIPDPDAKAPPGTKGGNKSKDDLERERAASQDRTAKKLKALSVQERQNLASEIFAQEGYVKAIETKLQAEKDPARQQQLQEKWAAEKATLLQKQGAFLESELADIRGEIIPLQEKIADLSKQIADAPEGAKAKLVAEKSKLETQLKAAETGHEYLLQQERLQQLRGEIHKLEAERVKTAAEAAKTTSEWRETLDDRIKVIDSELATKRSTLVEGESRVKTGWDRRVSEARSSFDQKLNNIAKNAEKNPMKAMVLSLAAAEALRAMGRANYDPAAKHRVVPDMLAFFDSDIENGVFGLRFLRDRRTDELGILGTALVEGGRAAVNVTVTAGVITIGGKALSAVFPRTAAFLGSKSVGTVLNGVGAFADGALTWSDKDLLDPNEVSLSSMKTWSDITGPIVTGAIGGGFVGGPIGATVGALAAAGGELWGMGVALNNLDQSIKKNTRMSGVRETIRLYEEGFRWSPEHEKVKGRADALQDWETDAINKLAQAHLLGWMFSNGDFKDPLFDDVGKFSKEDLAKMGFQTEQEEGAGAHNYQLLLELMKPREGPGLGFLGTGNKSYRLDKDYPKLATRLGKAYNLAVEDYQKKYDQGPRQTYTPADDNPLMYLTNNYKSEATKHESELPEMMKEAQAQIEKGLGDLNKARQEKGLKPLDAKDPADRLLIAEVQWATLAKRFPSLFYHLTGETARSRFMGIYKNGTGIQLEDEPFWTDRAFCPTGLAFVAQQTPKELPRMIRSVTETEQKKLKETLDKQLK